jgi:hypothetical protein
LSQTPIGAPALRKLQRCRLLWHVEVGRSWTIFLDRFAAAGKRLVKLAQRREILLSLMQGGIASPFI